MNVSEATKLILVKSSEAPSPFKECGKAATMYWAASRLWDDEYASWKAIAGSSLGPDSPAAKCAWERRDAYVEASCLLLQTW